MKASPFFVHRRTAVTLLLLALEIALPTLTMAQSSRPGKAAETKTVAQAPDDSTPRPKPFDYSTLNALLSRYVSSGRVNYALWKKDGTKELDQVLLLMSEYPYARVLAREERLSFLLNAYNAFVIRSVLDAYPVASVKDIPGFFDTRKHKLADGAWTLDEIEKNLIGSRFSDLPAYHFALVCGARGCPPLNAAAIQGDSLNLQTGRNLRAFVADSTKMRFSEPDNVLHLSELFRWYAADFEKGDQTIPRLLAPHFSLSVAMRMMQEEPKIEYLPFDWSLNDAEPSGGGK